MTFFSIYAYGYYMDDDYGKIEPRYLLPAGTILLIIGYGRILDIGITDF